MEQVWPVMKVDKDIFNGLDNSEYATRSREPLQGICVDYMGGMDIM